MLLSISKRCIRCVYYNVCYHYNQDVLCLISGFLDMFPFRYLLGCVFSFRFCNERYLTRGLSYCAKTTVKIKTRVLLKSESGIVFS